MIAALLSLVSISSSSSHFVLPSFLIPGCVSWISPCLVCLYLVWTIAHVIGLLLFSSPLDIVRRSKTPACRMTALWLACVIPVCWCFDPACGFWPRLEIKLANGSARLTSRSSCYADLYHTTETLISTLECFRRIVTGVMMLNNSALKSQE